MGKEHGYILLYRDIRLNEMWSEEPFTKAQAFIDLLLRANHSDKNVIIGNQAITVRRGELVTSVSKLAEDWQWSRNKVRGYLELLGGLGMIKHKKDSKKTVIKVLNYAFYQDCANTKRTVKGQSSDSEWTVAGQSLDSRRTQTNNYNTQKNNYKKNKGAPPEQDKGSLGYLDF